MAFTLIVVAITLLLFIITLIFKPELNFRHFSLPTYWIPPFIATIVLLIFTDFSFGTIIELSKEGSMNTLEILTLFMSMALISLALDSTGFFDYLAAKCVKRVKNQHGLFFILGLLVSLLTIVTSNDIIILTITPFIIALARRMNVSPIPYLIEEFVLANSFSSFLLIGNPTNIFLTSFYDISFFEYAKNMALPSLVSGLVSFGLLYLFFRRLLKKPISVVHIEPKLEHKRSAIIFGSTLIIVTITLSISNFINISMWLIALIFAILDLLLLILLKITYKRDYIKTVLKHMPWFLAPFVLSMSSIVLSLEYQGILGTIYDSLSTLPNNFIGGLTYSLITLFLANLTNNIPCSLLVSKILTGSHIALYGSVLALNLGAFVTPVGALAGIMWKKQLKKENVDLYILRFIGRGLVLGITSLVAGVLVLTII